MTSPQPALALVTPDTYELIRLQHALVMLAGLITLPITFASRLILDTQTSAYMVSVSLVGCGA
jgi:xanthine/uracil permease